MQFKNLALVTLFSAASAAPAPQSTSLPSDAKFGLIAIRSGSPIQNAGVSAARSSIFVNLPTGTQNATCDAPSDGFATFYIQDGFLRFYSTDEPQTLYADRSGMGQGKFGYTTGAQPPPRNGEQTTWAVNADGHLELNGNSGFTACPNSILGAWSVWANAGVDNPAGNSNCTGIALRAIEATAPNSCFYTE